MVPSLVQALVSSQNEAADDVLLEALRLGNEAEQAVALEALFKRQTVHGLSGVVARYEALPDSVFKHGMIALTFTADPAKTAPVPGRPAPAVPFVMAPYCDNGLKYYF